MEKIEAQIGNGRIGLAVVDMQTFHRGHNNLLNEMRMTCDKAIIGLGSIRKYGIHGHPFTFEQRKAMISALHGDHFDFIPLDDIDAGSDIKDWYAYVSSKLVKAGLPEPADYFSGSRIDAKWYFHAFADESHPSKVHGTTSIHTNPSTEKRLHIVNREVAGLPSGREVRLLIETRDDEWKKYVPERLHSFIEMNYPPELRQPLDYDRIWNGQCTLEGSMVSNKVEARMSRLGDFPVGTKISGKANVGALGTSGVNWDGAIKEGPEAANGTAVLELKDDGRWRPIRNDDEKANWAKSALSAAAK